MYPTKKTISTDDHQQDQEQNTKNTDQAKETEHLQGTEL